MTQLGLDYLKYNETKRSNLAGEAETNRANVARETETKRSNLAQEAETNRSNLVKEAETRRSNLAKEAETHRTNIANEAIKSDTLEETKRSNLANELIKTMQNEINSAKNEISLDKNKYEQALDLMDSGNVGLRHQGIEALEDMLAREGKHFPKFGAALRQFVNDLGGSAREVLSGMKIRLK